MAIHPVVVAAHAKTITDLDADLVCEMSPDAGEDAAAARVNGQYAGGFIGKPYRVEISNRLKAGSNTVLIEPFPVSKVWLEWH